MKYHYEIYTIQNDGSTLTIANFNTKKEAIINARKLSETNKSITYLIDKWENKKPISHVIF